ncbi:hypothetical protein M409DRAFT_53185 [Zasmidium cellare ATCC 36951]|uniref:Beta-lactamase-related domain-containing protein n=1 Tax=Zasmidium cellare ATCC 36951 TaxID=1080233 RepID=A0A6A6CRS0_ZASCE|nr:uncharacterized protein M409DRAFT_53185 [Zasmidium cellare ATCC 36951]KAF2168522.1 hypothetical protein M409DRAFT_53185 [Zasmidium cellare ATCC 36951]
MAAAQRKYLTDARRERIEQLLAEYHVPGAGVAVVYGDVMETEVRIAMRVNIAGEAADMSFCQGYGRARLSPDSPATSSTLFHIGSLTKAMTAAAAGKVFELPVDPKVDHPRNKVLEKLRRDRFATKIQSVLPEFALEDEYISKEATIEDALSHRTGMDGADKLYGDWMGRDPAALVRALRWSGPPTKSFRNAWQYNNVMYSVVGAVLQEATGKAWGDVLKEFLWKPLGMESTVAYSAETTEEDEARLARGYYWNDSAGEPSAEEYLEEPFLAFAGIGPAGSTVSSAGDMARWIRAMLAGARGETESLISAGLFQELATPRIFQTRDAVHSVPGQRNGFLGSKSYSLGWFDVPNAQGSRHPVVCHGGGLTGFGSMLFLLPNDDFGCVLLGNTTESSHVIGEIACLELLADRLELEGQARREFIESVQTASSDAAIASIQPTLGRIRFEDLRIDFPRPTQHQRLLEEISGTYQHPAYGSYNMTALPDSESSTKIVYGSSISEDLQKERSKSRATKGLLLVQPLGHRSWRNLLEARQCPSRKRRDW